MKNRLVVLTASLLLTACPDAQDTDRDADGHPAPADCDDSDPTIFPGAPEVVEDGVDQDCNGADSVWCFYDGDGDGIGHGDEPNQRSDAGVCAGEPLFADVGGDCDDSRPDIYPGGDDVPDDGLDQDCSGADTAVCRPDADGDGWGSDAETVLAEWPCDASGLLREGGDCDDGADAVFPGADEVVGDGIDQDCSGSDAVACWYDGDADGFGDLQGPQVDPEGTCAGEGLADNPEDCDDASASRYPGAPEVCNELDDDCDGIVDHGQLAAWFLTGGTSRIELPSFTTDSDSMTVEAWVQARAGDFVTAPAVWKQRTAGGEDLWLGADAGPPAPTPRSSVFAFAPDAVGGSTLPEGVWRHLAMTYDGSTHALYVDGALVATSGGAGPLNLDLLGVWQIGGSLDGAGDPLESWFGAVDDVRIWSVARSEAEIAGSRCAFLDGSEPGLVAWYPLEGNPDDAGPGELHGAAVEPAGLVWQGR